MRLLVKRFHGWSWLIHFTFFLCFSLSTSKTNFEDLVWVIICLCLLPLRLLNYYALHHKEEEAWNWLPLMPKCNFIVSLYMFLYIFNFFHCAMIDELSNTWCREERPFPVFLLNTLTYNFFPQMDLMLSKNFNITCTLLWLLYIIYLRDGPTSKAAEKFTEYGPIRVSILFCRLIILLMRLNIYLIFYTFSFSELVAANIQTNKAQK